MPNLTGSIGSVIDSLVTAANPQDQPPQDGYLQDGCLCADQGYGGQRVEEVAQPHELDLEIWI